MALSPIPVVASISGSAEDAPAGSVPLAAYGFDSEPTPTDPVIQALNDAGFGAEGQILATNASGDGFEWIDAPEA